MTDVTCGACGSTQAAGAAWCAVCGTAFARTGAAPAPAAAPPVGQIQAASNPGVPSIPVPVHTGTTEPERLSATVRGVLAPEPESVAAAPAYAGTGRRFLAYLIDGLVLGVVAGVVLLLGVQAAGVPLTGGVHAVTGAEAQQILASVVRAYLLTGLVALLAWLALVIWEGRTGRTVGGLLLRLRTVDAETRRPVGFGRSLLRWLLVGVSGIVPGVGQLLMVLSPAFDSGPRRQGWHDKAVRAVVLHDGGRFAPLEPAGPSAFAVPGAVPAAPAPRGVPSPAAPAVPAAPVVPAAAVVPRAPVVPSAPAGPAVPDPWAFPEPGLGTGVGHSGVITGVPGTFAPSAAPVPAAPLTAPSPPAAAAAGSDPARLADAGADDLDGETRMTPVRPRALVLELATGERHPVTGRTLLGRNPQAPDGEPWDVVAVPDPTRSVSKTHAELHPDPGGLWLVDRGSTNGTVISVPGRAPQLAEPGARVRVTAGATVHVGDARILVHPEAS